MKYKLLPLVLLPLFQVQAELFISEYIEGSGHNKAIELYNPTSQPISLQGYQLKTWSNGSATVSRTLALSGVVQPFDTFVLADDQAHAAVLAVRQYSMGTNNYNGDDAVALTRGEQFIDVIGRIGEQQVWGSGDIQTQNRTLVRKPGVNQGDTNPDDNFIPSEQWLGYPQDTFAYLGNHQFTGSPVDPGEPEQPPVTVGQCGEEKTYIHTVQGDSDSSPLLGQTVIIEGVVTAVFADLDGYFVQESAVDHDNDPATSEGIFVYRNNITGSVNTGNRVRIAGTVDEYYTRTQLRKTEPAVDCGPAELITPVAVTLPVSSTGRWEQLEGMLVQFSQSLSVTDNYNLGRYGEVTLAGQPLRVPTDVYPAGSAAAIALADENRRNRIVLDDVISGQNPAHVRFPNPGLSFSNTLRTGDQVSQLTGIIDYSFNLYRILPVTEPEFTTINPRIPEPQLAHQGNIRVASFNVLNYFNGDGNGGGFPTARGAKTAFEFERQSAKIVNALAAMNADIIGLIEIENDGFGEHSAIAELTSRLNNTLGTDKYQYVALPLAGIGTDAITNGLIYNSQTISEAGTAAMIDSGAFSYGSRPTLIQTFTALDSEQRLTVAVNHFRSKSCGSSATGANADQGDGQSCWNAQRMQAAEQLLDWLQTSPTGITEAKQILLGDFNAYSQEDPMQLLYQAGFSNALNSAEAQNTSYVYQGEAGSLDHALLSAGAAAVVTDATVWQINSPEPFIFEYGTDYKSTEQITTFYSEAPYRSSDHDPIILELSLTAAYRPGDLNQDGVIDTRDVSLFNQLLLQQQPLDSRYDFNQDGTTDQRDVRALMALCDLPRCEIIQ
ncbi:ExeM/NucH family extracellular endonuclease [Chromatiaceae bacterium AAb-1]|nr:ExeM/NucH family extracellular endonuclease [Chromatiaceae bacterium AAb-1]